MRHAGRAEDVLLNARQGAGHAAPGALIKTLMELHVCHAGRVEDILQTYDRERRVLPPPVRLWEWGWTKSAETWNGRIASARPPTLLPGVPVCCLV